MARKILLADDSVTAQNMGRKILADAGYEVIAVNNGSAALKKIAELKPDLVILDVYMPGYSGLEVCQRLKESGETARIPVLLTVGKLEPFKPEEAQRVRAEGFIVKPFEASELLSALSKLEDKVVPRAEPTKPGRFARAIAAAEEAGRGNRNETAGQEGGWKSRIGFPQKKTEAEEKVADEVSTYNPVNRDLRTVVETEAEKSAGKALEQALEQEEQRRRELRVAESGVDVAALAPSGLPKDVTPEEVAAIAAAAAQLQMAGTARKDEVAVSDAGSRLSADAAEKVEERFSRPLDGPAASPLPAQEAAAEKMPESNAVAADADHRRNGDEKRQELQEERQDVPMTMAGAAESETPTNGGSRWAAVAVALEGDEASLSLEHEMRQAYAGFAAGAESAEAETAPAENSSALETPVDAPAEIPGPAPDAARQLEPAVQAAAAEIAPEPVAQPAVASVSAASDFVTPSFESREAAATARPGVTDAQSESPISASIAEPNQPSAPTAETVSASAETKVAAAVAPEEKELQPSSASDAVAGHDVAPIVAAPIVREAEPAEEPRLDSETVKSTAAAWASWRQIRDISKDAAQTQPNAAPPKEFDVPESAPVAARAVAAGAEKMLETANASQASDPSAIASIVDSVLADLRPKLMEEISRKMAQKK